MEQKLSTGFKSRFAIADLGFMTLRSMADFFLLIYLTDVAGINPAIVGSALLFGKLTWDAINDPLFGYWSDRTRSRFGRRRIYMLIAAIPLALVTWFAIEAIRKIEEESHTSGLTDRITQFLKEKKPAKLEETQQ